MISWINNCRHDTYFSKLFEPESMQTDNRQPPGQAAQLNFRPQNLPLNMKSGPGMQSQYFQSYSSPPIPQQVSTLILKNRTQPDSTPVTNYHRPESKRRHQSPNQDTVKSSFFDWKIFNDKKCIQSLPWYAITIDITALRISAGTVGIHRTNRAQENYN